MGEESLGCEYDPEVAVNDLGRVDEQIARLIKCVGPCRLEIPKRVDLFQALVRSIVYQQLSGKAAETIYKRMLDLFQNGRKFRPHQVLALPDDSFRGAGMSRAKVVAVKDLAKKILGGNVPPLKKLRKMTDEEIVSCFVKVKGIGIWTVQMLLIFHFGRRDVLPTGDLGVRKGVMLTYGMAKMLSSAELQVFGDRWKPYRSVASWYFWRAVDIWGLK